MPTSGDDATGDNSTADGTISGDGGSETSAADDATSDDTTADDTTAEDTTEDVAGHDVDGAAEEDAAETALSAAIDDADGHPTCALCSKSADYFLYETDHVEKFVCWEHVSPHSAAVDGEDARPGRPLALSL